MITQSGILVTPDNLNCPSTHDVALSLGRMPRFAGHTRVWWTVLHHSLVCLNVSQKLGKPAIVQLWALWHDAHESVTGDIPTTWKIPEIKVMQNALDERFMDYLGVYPSIADLADVSAIDRIAFLAESWVLGPPGIKEWAKLDRPPLFTSEVRSVAKIYRSTEGLESSAASRFVFETQSLVSLVTRTRGR